LARGDIVGRLVSVVLLVGASSCFPRPPAAAMPDAVERYADRSMWLCRGDVPRVDDLCRMTDLTATEIRHDGRRLRVNGPYAADDPPADCFYVYPTVDLSLRAGNHEALDDVAAAERATIAQAARFREVCAVFAPKYRQITIGAYLRSPADREAYLAAAYADVLAAFRAYLAHFDSGRPLVLIGHSQGAEMVQRLLAEVFDGDPALRARLLVAMAIGGRLDVRGESPVSDAFPNVPLCTRDDQRGCVIAYRSFAGGTQVTPGESLPAPGMRSACTNPADLEDDGRYHPISASYFPLRVAGDLLDIPDDVQTPFVMVRRFYSARCETGEHGLRWLSIQTAPATATDPRLDLLPLHPWRRQHLLGLHIFDIHLTQGALIDLVRTKLTQGAGAIGGPLESRPAISER
jgi:hypothetical protein